MGSREDRSKHRDDWVVTSIMLQINARNHGDILK